MLTSPVRDAPPMARAAPVPGVELPRPAPEPAREERPPAREARPAKTNGASAPRLIKRPGYLAVHSVEKSFGTRQVVRGVSIYVRRGEAVGLLGPNGAGKTTVFYMITGLIKADRGAIELDGHDVTKLPMYQRARLGIGYLPQEASIFRGLSVEQNIRAVLEVVEPSRKKREAELDALLDEFNITRLRKTPSIALSGGERRRVEIARALATRPELHAARRTLRRHRPDRGRRHPGSGPPSHQSRHRRPDHRPQCAGNARTDRPRLHRLCRGNLDGGQPG